jgi:hypothetical protein
MEVDALLLPTIMEEEEIGDWPCIAGAGGGVAGGRRPLTGKQMGDGRCQGKQWKGPTNLLLNDTSEPTLKAQNDTRHQAHRQMNYRLLTPSTTNR